MEPVTELMLFGADRAQHVAEVIRPALDAGRVVLCDRFSDATLAYQGHGRKVALETVNAVDRAARAGVQPDMTVLLDLPPQAGLQRARSRNVQAGDQSESRIDEENLDFHQRVRDGYLNTMREDPERFFPIDGSLPPSELSEAVITELEKRFPNVF
jgi:dTMP kinase